MSPSPCFPSPPFPLSSPSPPPPPSSPPFTITSPFLSPHTLSVHASPSSLQITLYTLTTLPTTYTSTFTPEYIEAMTSRTGNYKSYNVFTRMLYDGVQCYENKNSYNNNAVATQMPIEIRVVGAAEMEVLKAAGKHVVSPLAPLVPSPPTAEKTLYLILTYHAPFDKVHYPLPVAVAPDDDPTDDVRYRSRCEKEIERLREALREQQTPSDAKRLPLGEETFEPASIMANAGGRREVDNLMVEYRRLESESKSTITKLRRELNVSGGEREARGALFEESAI